MLPGSRHTQRHQPSILVVAITVAALLPAWHAFQPESTYPFLPPPPPFSVPVPTPKPPQKTSRHPCIILFSASPLRPVSDPRTSSYPQVRKWTRDMKKEERQIQRNIREIEREENKIKSDIKKYAKKGQVRCYIHRQCSHMMPGASCSYPAAILDLPIGPTHRFTSPSHKPYTQLSIQNNSYDNSYYP